MIPPTSPDRRRSLAPVWLFAIGLMLLSLPPAAAAPGSGSDPDDVPLRLDLKTVSHADDGSSITYTAETYEEFPNNLAAFKWTIDKNGDQRFDLIVFAEWEENELVAGVDDMDEEPVAEATPSRPAPNTIQVSFSAKVIGSASSYDYRASAEDDLNDNGETEAGEQDVAPDSGLYRHDLGVAAAAAPDASPTPSVTSAPTPAQPTPPVAASGPDSSVAPGPSESEERQDGGAGVWALVAGVVLIAGGLLFVMKRSKPPTAKQP
jgi:hypothetical protein